MVGILSLRTNHFANAVKYSEMNVFAMRLGPGKHLQGRTLLGGVIKTEEYDHFHEVCMLCPPKVPTLSTSYS